MSQYAPIPAAVLERLPTVLAKHASGSEHPDPFDIQIGAFTGNDGEQLFAIDIYTDPELITPKDRRQKPYMAALHTTYYFDPAGGDADEPTSWNGRYR